MVNLGRVDPSYVGHYHILDNIHKANSRVRNLYAEKIRENFLLKHPLLATREIFFRAFRMTMKVLWLVVKVQFVFTVRIFSNFEGI